MAKKIKALVSFAGGFKPEHIEQARKACLEQGVTPIIRDPLDIITMPGAAGQNWKSKMAEAEIYLGIFMKLSADFNIRSFFESSKEAEEEYDFAKERGMRRYILIEGEQKEDMFGRPQGIGGYWGKVTFNEPAQDIGNLLISSRYEKLKKRALLESFSPIRYFQNPYALFQAVKMTLGLHKITANFLDTTLSNKLNLALKPAPAPAEKPAPVSEYPKSIFISYARSDWKDYAQSIKNRLSGAGLKVWVDQHLIEGGQDWLDEINAALARCETLALCVTPAALKSKWVKMEYRYFFSKGKPIVPIICREAELPAELIGIHYYQYEQMNALIKRLKKISR